MALPALRLWPISTAPRRQVQTPAEGPLDLDHQREGGQRVSSQVEEIFQARHLAGAEGDLDRILSFEIARHFPFPVERVFYRYRIVSLIVGAAGNATAARAAASSRLRTTVVPTARTGRDLDFAWRIFSATSSVIS